MWFILRTTKWVRLPSLILRKTLLSHAKENVYAFDYVKEKKDTWEILFEELLVWIGKGEVINVG